MIYNHPKLVNIRRQLNSVRLYSEISSTISGRKAPHPFSVQVGTVQLGLVPQRGTNGPVFEVHCRTPVRNHRSSFFIAQEHIALLGMLVLGSYSKDDGPGLLEYESCPKAVHGASLQPPQQALQGSQTSNSIHTPHCRTAIDGQRACGILRNYPARPGRKNGIWIPY
jgi:hypothetical protein